MVASPQSLADLATDLCGANLLSTLDTATFHAVAATARRCTFYPGQFILFADEQPPGLFFVLQGRVRLTRTAPDGREQVLALARTGESFGLTGMFDTQPSLLHARAMSPVTCALIPYEDLHRLLQAYSSFAMAVMRAMARENNELIGLVEDLAFRSVRARVARQLLADHVAGQSELTHQELAERTGSVREMIGRVLRRLAEEGSVRLARGRIFVLDSDALIRITHE